MEYTWQILKCNTCNNIHAMPLPCYHKIYDSGSATYTCPYCGTRQLIYSSKCDKMIANKGIDKYNNETIENDIKGYQE